MTKIKHVNGEKGKWLMALLGPMHICAGSRQFAQFELKLFAAQTVLGVQIIKTWKIATKINKYSHLAGCSNWSSSTAANKLQKRWSYQATQCPCWHASSILYYVKETCSYIISPTGWKVALFNWKWFFGFFFVLFFYIKTM